MCKMLGVRLMRRIEFAIYAYVSGVGQTPNVKEVRRIPSRQAAFEFLCSLSRAGNEKSREA